MNGKRIRPVIPGKGVKTFHSRMEVEIDEQAIAIWNLQGVIHLARLWISKATEAQRGATFRFENGFHGGKFDGLGVREETSIKITADHLQGRRDNTHCHRQQ